jgi:bleomycin hydrolase
LQIGAKVFQFPVQPDHYPVRAVQSMTKSLSVAISLFLFLGSLPGQKGDFKIEVEHPRLPSVSQGRTGTCWSFATTSFVESELERLHGAPVNLSEIHTVYYAYIEKARRYVRLHGKTQFDEGGLCHDVMYLIDKYGVVPQAAFTGLCDGDKGHNHGEMVELLKIVVEKVAKSPRPSQKWESAVRGMLEGYLGPVPDAIEVHGRNVTPKEYARKVLKIKSEDYRQIMSLEGQPFWKTAELLVPDNWMRHQGYWNVPIATMMKALDHAVRKGFTVAIDIDVSEPTTRGYVWTMPKLQEKTGAITDKMRQKMFDDRSTTDDHLMHIVGIARNKDGRTFYLTKDSIGQRGPFKGHRMISTNYLMAKMLSFMVHKDGIESTLTKRFK